MKYLKYILLWGIFFILVARLFIEDESDDLSTTRSDDYFIQERGSKIGCKNRETLERASNFAAVGDTDAFALIIAGGLTNGDCIQFSAGERVIITEHRIFSGLRRIRKSGSIYEYWILAESVKQDR